MKNTDGGFDYINGNQEDYNGITRFSLKNLEQSTIKAGQLAKLAAGIDFLPSFLMNYFYKQLRV